MITQNRLRQGIRVSTVATLAMAAAFGLAQNIGVTVNGQPVHFDFAEPHYMQGRVLVPLRGVFEEMGAVVQWHQDTKTVTAGARGKEVTLRIGSRSAAVNGNETILDVPAVIYNGSTMVPIRFISEALGAKVEWDDPTQTVMITTDIAGADTGPAARPARNWNRNGNRIAPVPSPAHRALRFKDPRDFELRQGTVIPVTLDTDVSSANNRSGDQVQATVQKFNDRNVTWEGQSYNFPEGTKVLGRITSAVPSENGKAGVVEINFDRVQLPDGRSFEISGSVVSLTDANVTRNSDGLYQATGTSKDNRTVYAGYGAGAGLVVGMLTKRPIEDLAIGGILGYLAGAVQQNQQVHNVDLKPGTRFGIRVDHQSKFTLTPEEIGG